MTNMTRTFKCLGCSTDFPVSITTDLEISDFAMLAKCPKCGNALQIHIFVPAQQAQPQQAAPTSSQLDDNIFVPPEIPSDEIRNLIEG